MKNNQMLTSSCLLYQIRGPSKHIFSQFITFPVLPLETMTADVSAIMLHTGDAILLDF